MKNFTLPLNFNLMIVNAKSDSLFSLPIFKIFLLTGIFTIALGYNLMAQYTVGTPSDATGTITDDDFPTVTSITLVDADPNNGAGGTLNFTVTFSDFVSGVDATDFDVDASGVTGTLAIGTVTDLNGDGTTWNVQVTGITGGNGTLSIDVDDDNSINTNGQQLGGTGATDGDFIAGAAYTIDNFAPSTLSFTRESPANENTNADLLFFLATFSEDVINVDVNDFEVNGTTTATATSVNQTSPSTYEVTVSGGDLAEFDGTVGINLKTGQNIQDLAGNALPTTEPGTD